MSMKAAMIEEMYCRSQMRQELLHQAKVTMRRYAGEPPDPNTLYDALYDISKVVEMLSASEDRVMQLHAECVSMLEHAGKILQLDASLRPIIVTGPAQPKGEDP